MSMISAVQIANIIKSIGGPPRGTTGPQWIALARGESGPGRKGNYDINAALFDTQAKSYAPCASGNRYAWGLWQFCENTLSKSKALDTITATHEAFKLHGRRGWQPWAASHSPSRSDTQAWNTATGTEGAGIGDSLDILGGLATNPGQAFNVITDPIEMVAGALEPLGDVANIIKDAAVWVGNPDNWVRILQVALGIILGAAAVNQVARPVLEKRLKGIVPGV